MDRRSFFTATEPSSLQKASFIENIKTTLLPVYAAITSKDLVHLLKRTLFGVKWADLQLFKGKDLDAIVNILLTPDTAPLPPINNYNNSSYTDPDVLAGQTWVNAPYGDGTGNSRRIASYKAWWAGLLINQPPTIHEKMVLFWHNHFATETSTINDARYIYKHNALLRTHALGNFKTLVKEITIDPAMLRYLNGYLSNKTSPDENYARELQELFVIGKGPNSKYTENDVKAAAKALTGYIVNATTISSSFNATRHDTTNKQFSDFYNNTLIAGKTGDAGATELDALLDMLFKQNEAALFICRKLYTFFVYYEIDAATEANVIVPMANIFRTSNYEIKPVLKVLFTSTHFFDTLNRGCMIKSPVDFAVGICREFSISFPLATDYVNQYGMHDYLRSQMATMEQNIGDPPNVAGWQAYYQVPQFHELWINSDTLPKRNQLSDILITTGYTRNSKKIIIDAITFVNNLSNPSDPNILIDDTLLILYTIDASQKLKDFLKSILLSGQSSDHYWTDAWKLYKLNVNDAMAKSTVASRLQTMLKYLMNLSEYQLS